MNTMTMKTESTTIYHGGSIVTVNDAQPRAEALAVKGGKILAVGALGDVKQAPCCPGLSIPIFTSASMAVPTLSVQ